MFVLSIMEFRDQSMEAPRSPPCTPKQAFDKPLALQSPGKRTRIDIDADDSEGEVASPNSFLSVTVHGSDSENSQ